VKPKTIGAGILMIDSETGDVLLGRRSFKGAHPNTWSPFGGTFEVSDGHPKNTAKREFEEESGMSSPYKISKTPFFTNDDNHLIFHTYLGIVDGKFMVSINGESLGYGWFQVDKVPQNLLPGFRQMLDKKKPELKAKISGIIEKDSSGADESSSIDEGNSDFELTSE
jgi:ADP-ribose pyrophosphatase YjhB (NUDIX family)